MDELIAAATVIVTAAGLWFVGGTRILTRARQPNFDHLPEILANHDNRKMVSKPTVRKAQFPGGNRVTEKRMPVAERQQETGTRWLALRCLT